MFVLYYAKISGERLQDHWYSGFYFDSVPRFPPFLLYVRWKSGVTFIRRCFRDAFAAIIFTSNIVGDVNISFI